MSVIDELYEFIHYVDENTDLTLDEAYNLSFEELKPYYYEFINDKTSQ